VGGGGYGPVIRLERSPDFWRELVDHPAVSHVKMGQAFAIEDIIGLDSVTPLATDHGGFLFIRLDGLSRVFELHTMFRPEGRGRDLTTAAKDAFSRMFNNGAMIITTYEVEGWAAPPLSFGWRSVGGFEPTDYGSMRTWVLTLEAWKGSPAFRRMH
jgi:hypothetical protein